MKQTIIARRIAKGRFVWYHHFLRSCCVADSATESNKNKARQYLYEREYMRKFFLIEKSRSVIVFVLLIRESNSIRVEEQENIVYAFVMLLYLCVLLFYH